MKFKTLQKKIRRLETRLLEGPKKLAKWKRKLEGLLAADAAKARKKLAAKKAAKRRGGKASPSGSRKQRPAAVKKRSAATKPIATGKVKKKRNLSPERRAQLSATMKARWAAKRAGTTAASSPGDQGFQVTDAVQSSENSHQGV